MENPRRGRQARNFGKNVPKIVDLKSSSEQIFSKNCRWVPLNLFCKLVLHVIIIFFYCYKNIISTFSSCPFTISHLGLWGKKNMPTPWMRAGTPDKPNMYRLHCTKNNTVKLLSISLAVPENIHAVVSMETILNLRNRTGEERRRQTLCDKRDNNFVWKNFRRTSPSVKQIFSYKTRKHWC